MKLLGIDTTKKKAKIFLINTSVEDISVLEMSDGMKHNESLFLFVEKILLDNNLSVEELDGFVCVVGPGSFTGIRVGMSVIKGFNKATKKFVLSLNSFELFLNKIKNGVVLLNSTTTSCYYAKISKHNIVEDGVVDKSQINEVFGGESIYIIDEEQKDVGTEYNNINVINDIKDLYYSAVINKLNNGDYGEFVPYYLQLSQAERNCK